MAMTPCLPEATLLPLALGGTVPADVQEHLASCLGCRDRLARLGADVRALRAGPKTHGDWRPPGVGPAPPVDDTEPLPPKPPVSRPGTIGNYVIVGHLGEGSQGLVYRAVHADLQRDAVIKLARKPIDPAGRNLLLGEGRMLAEMRHENLVEVYDIDVHEGRPYLAMELVRGCTLEQRAGQRRYSPREAAAIVGALARAVAYLDRRGVVHQDIKPMNIIIDEKGRPRLIDFGLAHLRDVWTGAASGPFGGTVAYMAPEQARGEVDRIGPASDVFALGGVLYFLLTGRPPNEGGDSARVLERARRGLVDGEALAAPEIPGRLAGITRKAMAADPAMRPSAGELADDLARYNRAVPRRAMLASGLVVALLAAGGWWYRHPSATDQPREGSTWSGTFYWTTDLNQERHPIELKITARRGDAFWGSYDAEDGQYVFRVEGLVRGESIRWRYLEQLRGKPNPGMIERASVECKIKGDNMDGRYMEGKDVAVMELRLSSAPR